jgi:hypothetical protein
LRRRRRELFRANRLWFRDGTDFFGKPVSASRHGDDIAAPGIAIVVTQSLAQHKNVLCQVGFLNKGIRPDRIEQFFLHNHPIAVTHQHQQGFERLWLQQDGAVIAREKALRGVQAKRAELV